MALFDGPDLLSRCQRMAKRPAIDADMTSTTWYDILTEAQLHWTRVLATHCPAANYGAPEQLYTPDAGQTYYFQDGNHNPVDFWGEVELRNGRNGELVQVGDEFDPRTELAPEQNYFRVPSGQTRTFTNGLWGRKVAVPSTLDGGTNVPTMKPVYARILLVYRACIIYASRGGYFDPQPYIDLETKTAFGDSRQPGDIGIIATLKRQVFGWPTVGMQSNGLWWQSGDLQRPG
jgi:hypothetical protein